MRTFWILLAGLAIVTTARADEAAEKVVKKAVEAHGGDKVLLAMKACETTVKLKVTVPGLEYEAQADMAYSLPDRYKVTVTAEMANQKITLVQSVNGTKARTTINGEEKKLKPKEVAELLDAIRTQEIDMIAPLLDASKYTLKAEKDAKVGGAEAAVVLVKAKGMNDTKLFFDKKTGFLVRMQRMVSDPSGDDIVDEVTDYSDFKKVDGIQTPMALKVLHDGEPYMTGKVTKLKYYEKLDDKKFRHEDLKDL